MNKRSTKFYRKNEEQVMKRIGLNPTPNSGAGQIWKEDGQSDHFICQLKSTDHQSISIKQADLHTLEYNAMVAHKLPLFAIQFLNTDEVWLMVKETDIGAIKNVLEGKKEFKEIEESLQETIDNYVPKSYNINMEQEIEARERYMRTRETERRNREKEYKEKQRERAKRWRESLSKKV